MFSARVYGVRSLEEGQLPLSTTFGRFTVHALDSEGRVLGDLRVKSDMGDHLVKQGLAVAELGEESVVGEVGDSIRRFERLRRLEQRSKLVNRGIWGEMEYVPMWKRVWEYIRG